ncbi:acyl-CoA dehydrogenase family protein [Caulobacter segnis]
MRLEIGRKSLVPGRTLVDFDYSDDQQFLKEEARKFLAAHCDVAAVRGVLDHAERSFDEKLWKGVAEQGWLGASIPEDHGGLGLGPHRAVRHRRGVGPRRVAPIPFASTVYFLAEGILSFGAEGREGRHSAAHRRRRADRLPGDLGRAGAWSGPIR